MTSFRFALVACAAVAAVAVPTATAATTRLVSPTGHDTGNCTNSPCKTIGYAISRANAGDTISVAAGTYSESVSVTKELSLVASEGDNGDNGDNGEGASSDGERGNGQHQGSTTTINAAGHDNGVVISGPAAAGSVVRGFTVRNAGLEGIFVVQTSHITIARNVLFDNDAYGPFSPKCVGQPDDCGEALHLQSVTDSTVRGNLVRNNVGGILLTDEDGPTTRNLIVNNTVLDNPKDCGITLASHSFSLAGPAPPSVGGVYDNRVSGNQSNRNGAAGIGVFAGPPGAAAYRNVIVGNVAKDNGLPGVAIHSHTPGQYVNDNVIRENVLSGNGEDDDAATGHPTGIVIFSDRAHGAAPIPRTVVAENRIRHEYYGIFIDNATTVTGLRSNDFSDVVVPLFTR
jgi:parallel beta-helix repeat protein